jgi:pyridoxine kinase
MLFNPIKKVAAIHDMSGVGKVSLTAVIPILSTMGMQVCPLPTALLSSNTELEGFKFFDMTQCMKEIIEHWKSLNLHFDAIYSGFLGSHEQIDIVTNFIQTFKKENQLVVIDPVLGDNGVLYDSMTKEMVLEMRQLIKHADLITPNVTEALSLLDMPYQESLKESTIKEILKELSDRGPKITIITNANYSSKKRQTFVYAYSKITKHFWKLCCDYIPANYPGTGDTFTSVVTGCLLQGDSLPIALNRAVQFITTAIRAAYGHQHDPKHGIYLEKVLPNLNAPFQPTGFVMLDEE